MGSSSLRFVLTAVLVAFSVLVTSCGDEAKETPPSTTSTPDEHLATPQPTSIAEPPAPPATSVAEVTPGAGVTLWRWVNVTVLVPEGSDVTVGRGSVDTSMRPNGGPGMDLTINHDGDIDKVSYVVIDAVTGEVLYEQVAPEDRTSIYGILATMSVSPIDRAIAPWPHNGDGPDESLRESPGQITFFHPSPETGLKVYTTLNDPGGIGVTLSNGSSSVGAYVDPVLNTLVVTRHGVLPEDSVAFDRWLSAVKLCTGDPMC